MIYYKSNWKLRQSGVKNIVIKNMSKYNKLSFSSEVLINENKDYKGKEGFYTALEVVK